VLALVAVGTGVSVAGTGVKVLVAVGTGVDVSVGLAVDVGVGVSVFDHCTVTVGKLQDTSIPTKNRLTGRIGWRIFRMASLPW
jgi:hypothetical protein